MRHRWISPTKLYDAETPAVNLTPLIDIVFVILIMFIVVAPLLELDQIQLASGPDVTTEHTRPVSESAQINIHVKQDNTVYLNSAPIGLELLGGKLKEQKQRYPNSTPQLFHDKTAQFGVYQAIKNATEAAGFSELDIILLPTGKMKGEG